MGWLGRGLGDFGSQLGEATDIRQKWAQNLLQQKMQKAQYAHDQMMWPLQFKQLQQQLSQFGQPVPAGLRDLPGGGIAGITYDRDTGKYSSQDLIPSQRPQTVAQAKQIIQQMAAQADALGPQHKGRFDPYLAELDLPDSKPEEVLNRAVAENNSIDRTAPRKSGWEAKTGLGGEPLGVINYDTNQYYTSDDPKLPPEGQAAIKRASKVASDNQARQDHRQQVAASLAQARMIASNNLVMTRQFTMDAQKMQDRYLKSREQLAAVPQLPDGAAPNPSQSLALANALDRIEGGTSNATELRSRGKTPPTTILGTNVGGLFGQKPYTPPAYSGDEYNSMFQTAQAKLAELQQDANEYSSAFPFAGTGGGNVPPPTAPPPPGFTKKVQ